MASFSVAMRRVRHAGLPEPVRFIAFLWAMEAHARLTGESFQATYLRMGAMFKYDWEQKPDAVRMTRAIGLVAEERRRFLIKLAAFRVGRIAEKKQGRRQPSRALVEEFRRPDWLMARHPASVG